MNENAETYALNVTSKRSGWQRAPDMYITTKRLTNPSAFVRLRRNATGPWIQTHTRFPSAAPPTEARERVRKLSTTPKSFRQATAVRV